MTIWDSNRIRILVEISSAVAVLLGLVFVGMELRQNTSVVSAQAIHDLNESANNAMLQLAENAELADLTLRGNQDPGSLGDIERQQYNAWLRAVFNIYESAWIYKDKGLIDQDDFAAWQSSFCRNVQQGGFGGFWRENSDSWSPDFVADTRGWCVTE